MTPDNLSRKASPMLWNKENKIKKNTYKKRTGPGSFMTTRQKLVFAATFASIIAVMTLFGFSVVAAYDLAVQSPFFSASRVEVTGNKRLSASEIMDQAKISANSNVLSINLGEARARLTAHPWIAWAAVSRRLPDGLEIQVREHTAMAILHMGHKKYLMNTEGLAFKLYGDNDPTGLPEVRGLKLSDVSITGEPMRRPAEAVVDYLHKMQAVGFPLPKGAITGLRVDPDLGLSITAFDPAVTVYLGWNNYDEKTARLKRVIYELSCEKGLAASSIDLSQDDRIVVRPVPEAAQIRKKARKEA